MTQKPTITTVEQLRKLDPAPCALSLMWLDDHNITDLADAWDQYHRGGWLLWLDNVLDLLDDRERRLIACRLVRETPLAGGRTVWDLLEDDRSRAAVEVAERYAAGEATGEELAAAYAAAAYAAEATVGYAAEAAAEAAARAAAARADAADTAAAATAAVARAATPDTADEDAVDAAEAAAVDAADTAVADIIRSIVGNPWRAP